MNINPTQEDITAKPNVTAKGKDRGIKALKASTNDRRATSGTSKSTKVQSVITLLRRKKGATLNELANATGWQHHSVRGLISGTIKKKLLLNVVAEKGGKLGTRYRIETDMSTSS